MKLGADLQAKDNHGNTPLHYAVRRGHATIARALIEKGVPTEEKNQFGETPSHLASKGRHMEISYLLTDVLIKEIENALKV